MAVMAQKRRVEQEREERQLNNQSLFQQGGDKTSVKVHHPPGGRSSIVFG